MDIFEEALAVKRMLAVKDMTQSKLASLLGVSQPYVANKLRLLNFTDEVRAAISAAGLTERHARVLLRLKDKDAQLTAIEKIKAGKMTVARTEILVDTMLYSGTVKRIAESSPADCIYSFERSLDTALDLLRGFGIRTLSTTEVVGEKIYISICINR